MRTPLSGHRQSILTNQNPPLVSQLQREAFVEKALWNNISTPQIITVARDKLNMSERACRRLITSIRARWQEEHEERRRYYKLTAMYRLHDTISEAKRDKKWGDVIAAERLLAQLQGTLEPVQHQVEFTFKQAVADYLSNLTEEELLRLNDEYEDLQRSKAALEAHGEPIGAR
jgi:hypothetical protein